MKHSLFSLKHRNSGLRVILATLLSLSLLMLSACSSSSVDIENKSTSGNIKNKNYVKHIHPENICFGNRAHAHPGGELVHEHDTQCVQSKNVKSNAHIHPATDKHPEMRHVHANGSNKHSHR